jgi:hypothetical protein
MAIHLDYYAARAVQAEEYAELAVSPSLADSYRRVAKSYWALAYQLTERKNRRSDLTRGCRRSPAAAEGVGGERMNQLPLGCRARCVPRG